MCVRPAIAKIIRGFKAPKSGAANADCSNSEKCSRPKQPTGLLGGSPDWERRPALFPKSSFPDDELPLPRVAIVPDFDAWIL
jgi:hypothetical protein